MGMLRMLQILQTEISMDIKGWVRFQKTIISFCNPASLSNDVTAAEAPASTCLVWAIKVVNFLLCLIFQYTFEWLHCSFMAHRINFLDVIHDLTVTQPDKIEKYLPTSRIKKRQKVMWILAHYNGWIINRGTCLATSQNVSFVIWLLK